MMRTDFLDRAVPWVRLLLRTGSQQRAATPSLGVLSILGTAAAGASAALLILALAGLGVAAVGLSILLALVAVAVSAGLYRYLLQKGGFLLMASSIPLHFTYLVLSAAAIPIGVSLYFLDRRRGSSMAARRPTATGDRFLFLAGGEIGARVIAFVATALIARRLGASGFGQIAFAMAVVSQFGTAILIAVGEGGARDVAHHPQDTVRIAFTGIILRICCVVVAIATVVLFGVVLRLSPGARVMTLLYAVALIPTALDPAWVYKGLGRTARVGVSLVISQACNLLFIVLLVKSAADVTRVPAGQFVGDLTAALFLAVALLKGKGYVPSVKAVVKMARDAKLLMASRMLRSVVVSFDLLLLGVMVSAEHVGWYSAAYRIVFFVVAIISAAHVAFLPEITQAASDPHSLSSILSRAIGLALTVTLPFVIGGILIATPLMQLVFGKGYEQGAPVLQILLLSLLVLGIHGVARIIFISMRQLRLEMLITGGGAVVNVIANFSLIPIYGIRGAAIATVAGETAILIGAFATLARMGIRPRLKESMPATIAGLVLAVTIFAVRTDRPVVQSVIIGGLVYSVSIAALTMLTNRKTADFSPGLG